MAQVEALREVKRVEDEVRRSLEDAKKQAADALRKARADAADIEAKGKADAEAAYAAEVDRAHKAVAESKTKILRTGAAEADKIQGAGTGAALNSAVDLIVKRFNDKIRG